MSKPIYITTPIYYVNDVPHIGHAYTTIAGDMMKRFYRLAGRDVYAVTGTDEHGNKVAHAAGVAGQTPQEFCDQIVDQFQKAWKNLDTDYDYFIRTTSERHKIGVRKFLEALRNAKTDDGQDVVYSDYYEGLYCTGCEKFITEKDLVDGVCPDHKTKPELLKEKNYFFRLTAFLEKIRGMIQSGEIRILPEERKREVLGLIKQELPDFSLSREQVKWGISLPFDDTQVAYVWVDALSNYINAIGYGDDRDTFGKWWTKSEVIHLMAKDILKFHCLYWPAMLLAAGEKPPEVMFLHGFFTVNGNKMSKTLGNQIDPNEMIKKFGSDGTRYLLMTQYPFGIDGDIQASRFVTQYNSDLANDLGNLVSRVGKMVMVNFDGKLPSPSKKIEITGLEELMTEAESLPGKVTKAISKFKLTQAISEPISLIRTANKFFNDQAPWILARNGETEKLGGVLYACVELIRIVSILLFPIMPVKMRELRSLMGLDDSTLKLDNARCFFDLEPGTEFKIEQPLFPRIEETKEKKQKQSKSDSNKDLLDIEEFSKVHLRVAQVIKAEPVSDADKLLKLQIDLGSEKRQIIAGIAKHYPADDLVGKKIIVVANLKPAKIRGVESNGMLLAASKGKKLSILTIESDLPPGTKVG